MASKIQQFFSSLDEGKTKNEARELAGIKPNTANRQFGIWKKASVSKKK